MKEYKKKAENVKSKRSEGLKGQEQRKKFNPSNIFIFSVLTVIFSLSTIISFFIYSANSPAFLILAVLSVASFLAFTFLLSKEKEEKKE